MLYLIGIGLKPAHLSREALDALKTCDNIFVESYTSSYSEGAVRELEQEIGKKVMELDRGQVEGANSGNIIASAKKNNIALCVFGNIFSATTHIQLMIDAKNAGVKCAALPGISIFSFLGKTGLDEYRFGRTATIVKPEKGYAPDSFFAMIEKNRSAGLHTLCLLDIKTAREKRKIAHDFLAIPEAISILEKIAEGKNKTAEFRNWVFA
ncbi:MAG: diphthine synthase, partial [Candidatus Diapherotrites archaeon]